MEIPYCIRPTAESINFARRCPPRAFYSRAAAPNEKQKEQVRILKVSKGYVGQAAVVLEYAKHLADAVIAGTLPLNDAYAEAQEARTARDGRGQDQFFPEERFGMGQQETNRAKFSH
jgi:hypothetical protein